MFLKDPSAAQWRRHCSGGKSQKRETLEVTVFIQAWIKVDNMETEKCWKSQDAFCWKNQEDLLLEGQE